MEFFEWGLKVFEKTRFLKAAYYFITMATIFLTIINQKGLVVLCVLIMGVLLIWQVLMLEKFVKQVKKQNVSINTKLEEKV